MTRLVAAVAVLALALVTVARPAHAEEAPAFTIEHGRLVLPSPVTFATGTAEILPESEPALLHVASFLAAKSSVTKLRIESHVDASGPAEGRLQLTKARAAAVARWLVARGVDCTRLVPVGFGDTKPVEDGSTPEGREANRRMEFVMAELRGVPIGGASVTGGGEPAGDPCGAE